MFIARGSTCIIIKRRMQNAFRPNQFHFGRKLGHPYVNDIMNRYAFSIDVYVMLRAYEGERANIWEKEKCKVTFLRFSKNKDLLIGKLDYENTILFYVLLSVKALQMGKENVLWKWWLRVCMYSFKSEIISSMGDFRVK